MNSSLKSSPSSYRKVFFVVGMRFKGRYRVKFFSVIKLRNTLINISKLKVAIYVTRILSRVIAASCNTNIFLNLENYFI